MIYSGFLKRLIAFLFLLTVIVSGKKTRKSNNDFKISQSELEERIAFSKSVFARTNTLENNLKAADVILKTWYLEYKHFILSYPDKEALKQAENYYIIEIATNLLKSACKRFNLEDNDCINALSTVKVDKFFPQCSTRKPKSCPNADYRSLDGSCNHVNDAIKGKSLTAYKRLIQKTGYVDDVSRVKDLKLSSRTVSSNLFKNETVLDERFTIAVVAWADFVVNDLAHTASRRMVLVNESIYCCSSQGYNLAPRYRHPYCLAIDVSREDKFYSEFGIECLSYVRSLPAVSDDCTLGGLNQMNQATHYLDASQVYGSDSKRSRHIRSLKNGLLRSQTIKKRTFLPAAHSSDICDKNDKNCFDGADWRSNAHPLLTTLHTLFLREHNRIAKKLKESHDDWTDDVLFEETRRIVIAEIQRITYKEFLPVVLGDRFYKKTIDLNDTERHYDDKTDPRVSNSFATAASKFFVSLIDDRINLYDSNGKAEEQIKLKKLFDGSSVNIFDRFESFLKTFSTQPIQKFDLNVPNDLKNHFFQKVDYGLDLISLLIQRGRDHGLLPYIKYRDYCGLKNPKTFDDLSPIIPKEIVKKLAETYKQPEDIDLFVGGLSETGNEDGILGPTFACIVADQFSRSQKGDRYFYSNKKQPKPFTNEQLKEIDKVSLASIICANSDVKKVQKNAFKMSKDGNNLTDCSQIPRINLDLFS